MNKILIMSVAFVVGTPFAAVAQGDKAVQGRPMGGLAMSMQDEQAMEAASLARARPTPMHKHMRLKRHMMHNAM